MALTSGSKHCGIIFDIRINHLESYEAESVGERFDPRLNLFIVFFADRSQLKVCLS